jgi:hypothetical protein
MAGASKCFLTESINFPPLPHEAAEKLWKCYVLMYENGKMRPVETIPGMEEGWIKEDDGGGEFNMIYYKNFGKYHNITLKRIFKNSPSCPYSHFLLNHIRSIFVQFL